MRVVHRIFVAALMLGALAAGVICLASKGGVWRRHVFWGGRSHLLVSIGEQTRLVYMWSSDKVRSHGEYAPKGWHFQSAAQAPTVDQMFRLDWRERTGRRKPREANRIVWLEATRVFFPTWVMIPALSAYPFLVLLRRTVRRSRRRKRGLCVKCGYNLTGLTENRCPECATEFEG